MAEDKMVPTAELAVSSFRYFAVYANGRRCEVSLDDVQKYGARWEANEGVKIETEWVRTMQPAYGHVVVVHS